MAQALVSQLTGAALDWAVGIAAGYRPSHGCGSVFVGGEYGEDEFSPSTNWAQGGPIIEREKIELNQWSWSDDGLWWVAKYKEHPGDIGLNQYGPTPLIAAMRCYVASKVGDMIEIPDELI